MDKSKVVSALIVEDELPARKLLMRFLKDYSQIELNGIARSGEEALQMLKDEVYDLLFLDIHLPDMSGIEILENIDEPPYIIFTTAYDKYAVKAFELGAVDYLLKPIAKERFDNAVKRFFSFQQLNSENKKISDLAFSFRENRKNYLISHQDIIYVSSQGKRSVIHTEERDFETSQLMKEIEGKLPEDSFIRVHKQYMVNRDYISHVQHDIGGMYQLMLRDEDDNKLPVGRTYLSDVKKSMQC